MAEIENIGLGSPRPKIRPENLAEEFDRVLKNNSDDNEIKPILRPKFDASKFLDKIINLSSPAPKLRPTVTNKVSIDFLAKYYNAEKGFNNKTWIKNATERRVPKTDIQKLNLQEAYRNFDTYAPDIFSVELKTLADKKGLSLSAIRETLSPIMAAESNFGLQIIGSKTDGSMQVIYDTFKDNLDQGYLGPKFIAAIDEPTIKNKEALEKLSEKDFKKLMRENKKFDHLLGTSVILQKLKAKY